MKDTRITMGMPATIDIVGEYKPEDVEKVFEYFKVIDERFSTYKDTSEISRINRGDIKLEDASAEMQEVFELSEKTKQETNGFFDIRRPDGDIDPSGIVKGLAIHRGALMLEAMGYKNFYVEIAGDIEVRGFNGEGRFWSIGVRNPFKLDEVVKVVYLGGSRPNGIATSGAYIRGEHIYNPHKNSSLSEVASMTIVARDVYEADRFATAAFAMGKEGIYFIEEQVGFHGYMIDKNGLGTETSGFIEYTKQ